MVDVYGFCDGNAVHAVADNQRRFSNRGMPTKRAFIRIYRTLRNTGTIFGPHIAAEHVVNQDSDDKGNIFSEGRKQCPKRECGDHCKQKACIGGFPLCLKEAPS